ncbi:MAG: alpha/beta hydrolase [Pseudomonadota bacterium]
MANTVFLDYDQAGLDAQYNLRERHKDFPQYHARNQATSAQARTAFGGRLDLAYGDSPGQRLDLFLPAAPRPPLVAFIHGGYWQRLDKSEYSYLAPAFLEAGIAFASINYDLAPTVSVGEIVRQARAAVAWLHGEAEAFGFDPARIVVAGHSAGGQLAAMVLSGEKSGTQVVGACAVSGVFDLGPMRLSYQQPVLQLTAAAARDLSPINALPASASPLILAVGDQETEEFLRQQADYGAAWRGAGHRLQVIDLPGRHHFTAVDALGEAGHPLHAAVSGLALNRGGGDAI